MERINLRTNQMMWTQTRPLLGNKGFIVSFELVKFTFE
jgi:hypothetical protein